MQFYCPKCGKQDHVVVCHKYSLYNCVCTECKTEFYVLVVP
jgi:hypothetical protein